MESVTASISNIGNYFGAEAIFFSFSPSGKIVSKLAKSEAIETGMLVHPALVKPEDIKGNRQSTLKALSNAIVDQRTYVNSEVKIPLAIIAAEVDFDSPPALIKQFEEILSSNKQVLHLIL